MMDPYIVLGLPSSAGEAEIRGRYLDLVRQFPPEREPERAAAVRAAYDAIRNPIDRLRHQLFELQSIQTLESIAHEHKPDVRERRLPTQDLLSLGRS